MIELIKNFKLETNDGKVIELKRSDLVFFLDETGQELFQDRNFPLFGLGGCGMSSGYYVDTIRPTWIHMKNRWFGGPESVFHAAELKNPTSKQISALATFFTDYEFLRVGAIATDKTVMNVEMPPFQLVTSCLQQRILSVLAISHKFERIYLFFEANDRTNKQVEQYFANFTKLETPDGREIPVICCFAPKDMAEPGLEIADAIMHTSGTQTRNRLRDGSATPFRKDWICVWQSVRKQLVSFMEVTKVEETAATRKAQ